jgi:hypothetical protein
MSDYAATLRAARRVGASWASDPQLMALFCESSLQIAVGAVAPSLVWEGAQRAGINSLELALLCVEEPTAVEELMWS